MQWKNIILAMSIGPLLLALAVPLRAQAHKPRALSEDERKVFLRAHSTLKERLLKAGLPHRATHRPRFPEGTPVVTAVAPSLDGRERESVSVDDDFLGVVFDRGRGAPVHVLSRAGIDWRGFEEGRGTLLPLSVTRERFVESANAYVAAIEGARPSEPGGVEEESLARFSTNVREAKKQLVSPSEEMYAMWPRMYKGFPFRDDCRQLSLCAATGEMFSYSKRYYSHIPTLFDARTSVEEATVLASRTTAEEVKAKATLDPNKKILLNRDDGGVFVSKAAYERELAKRRRSLEEDAASYAVFIGVEPSLLEPARLMIVNPNACYTDAYRDNLPGRDKWNPETRLAWVVKLLYEVGATPEQKRHLHMEIWIDAADGKVLGGELPY